MNDVIQELFRLHADAIYSGTNKPEEPHDYKFWWNEDELELLIFQDGEW